MLDLFGSCHFFALEYRRGNAKSSESISKVQGTVLDHGHDHKSGVKRLQEKTFETSTLQALRMMATTNSLARVRQLKDSFPLPLFTKAFLRKIPQAVRHHSQHTLSKGVGRQSPQVLFPR